jgi:hypothetical protein
VDAAARKADTYKLQQIVSTFCGAAKQRENFEEIAGIQRLQILDRRE